MSKKTKVVITIVALCLGLFLVGTKAYATTGKAINETTRIRKKANTTSEVVAVMTKGEKIEVLSEEDGWYKVKYKEGNNTITGYVRNDLLDVDNETKGDKKKTEEPKEEPKNEVDTEAETENKVEVKQENDDKAEAESETENKTESEPETEANVEPEVENKTEDEVEPEAQENVIKENEKIQLKSDTDVQLLPVIFSCKTGKITANTTVTVLEVVGNWARIEAEEQEGWISTTKLENSQIVEEKTENKTEEKNEDEKKEENETTKMYVNTVTLNLREKADTSSKVVTQLNKNDEVTVIKTVDSTWSQVKAKGYEGYTATEYLSTKKSKDTTSRNSEDIRKAEEARKKEEEEKKKEEEAKKKAAEEAKKKAEEEAKKKATEEAKKKAEEEAKKKAAEEAKKKEEEEAKKKAAEEAKKKEADKKKEEAKKETSSSEKTSSSSKKSGTTGEDIIAYAKKYLGYKYVYGTAGPKTFDCSGFTSYVYKHFGYSLNRTSGGQRSNGKKVEKSNLKAGDIVCFSGHVGLYIGGNKFIHAANPRKGVIISSLSESYYVKTYITARRIL